jgi:hypothetical protein
VPLLNFKFLCLISLAQLSFCSTVAYYRFEDGSVGNLVTTALDASGNGLMGSLLSGTPVYSSDVASGVVPQTGAANTESLQIDYSDAVSFGYAFPLNYTNATLEYWIKPDDYWNRDADVFWTTVSPGDSNRYNLYLYRASMSIDYRSQTGDIHELETSGGGTVPPGVWTFVAIVKEGNVYRIYINGQLKSEATDPKPASPPTNTGWTINGRGALGTNCCQFSGYLDEVRLSDVALAPSQFLYASAAASVPEPSSGRMLAFAGGLLVLLFGRGRVMGLIGSPTRRS